MVLNMAEKNNVFVYLQLLTFSSLLNYKMFKNHKLLYKC